MIPKVSSVIKNVTVRELNKIAARARAIAPMPLIAFTVLVVLFSSFTRTPLPSLVNPMIRRPSASRRTRVASTMTVFRIIHVPTMIITKPMKISKPRIHEGDSSSDMDSMLVPSLKSVSI
jgi:hypothetical protein